MFEFPVPSKLQNKQLQSVRYTSDFLRYTDNISSSLINSLTYNKAIVYNQKQTSGLLELVLKEKNDRRLSIMYPKQNQDSRSILVEYVENGYQFNQFYDVAKPNSNLMHYNCDNPSYTNINPLSIDYSPQPLKRKLTSDYHIIRLINDIHSEYQINHRFSLTRTNNINQ
jgi:hypothetical protein